MASWAVFDVDGTLLPGTSMEKAFLEFGLFRGVIPLTNFLLYLVSSTRTWLGSGSLDAFKANKMYLKGLPIEEINREASRFFRRNIQPRLSRRGLLTVTNYREQGYRILFLSGSPEFLVARLAAEYSPDYWIATRLEVRKRKFTGRLAFPHPYGEYKKSLLLQVAPTLEIDFGRSVVFANHHTDWLHMKLFGSAVAVNPTRKLARLARMEGWPVEWW